MKKKELLSESKAELIERAKELELPGRSRMTKEELAAEIAKALTRAEAARLRRSKASAESGGRRLAVSAARRSLEARAQKREQSALANKAKAEEKPIVETRKTTAADGKSGTTTRTVRPGRARRGGKPPGLDKLDLDGASSSTTVVARKKPTARISPIPEDQLSGGVLPKRYGRNRFILLTRDPKWLFAYWEVLDATEEKLRAKVGEDLAEAKKVLRVFNCSGDSEEFFDLPIHPGAKSWYIHLPVAGMTWRVELGLIGKSGRFYRLIGSKKVETPRKSVSPIIDEEYRTLDEEFDEIFRLSGGHLVGRAIQGIGGSAVGAPGPVGRRRAAGPEEEEERWSWAFPGSGGLGSGFPYSSGKPIHAPVGAPGKKDDFFFWVDCELILYGGTEPTAAVTVQGEKIKLRPDGTFSFRYALPDGRIDLPVVAVREDGKERRKATPIVTRKTIR
jgi:hypothetical protein